MKLQTPSLDKSCHWVPSIHKKNLSKFGGRLGGAQGLRRLLPRESAILDQFLFALAPLVEVVESNNVPRWKAENSPDILRGVATFYDKKCPQ